MYIFAIFFYVSHMAGTRLYIVLSFLFPIILLSPVAWILTRVHRSDLPFDSIKKLDDHVHFHIPVKLVYINLAPSAAAIANNEKILQGKIKQSKVEYAIKSELLSASDVQVSNDDLRSFGRATFSAFDHTYTYFIICNNEKRKAQWTMGSDRHGWVNSCDPAGNIFESLGTMLVHNIIRDPSISEEDTRIALSYRLSFTLLNENSTAYAASWAFPDVASQYLQGFLDKV